MSSTDSLRERVIDGLRQHLGDIAFSKYVRRGGLDHWIFNLIERYGLEQRIDERQLFESELTKLADRLKYIADLAPLSNTRERNIDRISELERKKEEL